MKTKILITKMRHTLKLAITLFSTISSYLLLISIPFHSFFINSQSIINTLHALPTSEIHNDLKYPNTYEYKLLLSPHNLYKLSNISNSNDFMNTALLITEILKSKINSLQKISSLSLSFLDKETKYKTQLVNFLDLSDKSLYNQNILLRQRIENSNQQNIDNRKIDNTENIELTLKIRTNNKQELLNKASIIRSSEFQKNKFEVDVVVSSDNNLNYYYSISFETKLQNQIQDLNSLVNKFFNPNAFDLLKYPNINTSHNLISFKYYGAIDHSAQIATIRFNEKINSKLVFSMWDTELEKHSSKKIEINRNLEDNKIYELSFAVKFTSSNISEDEKLQIINLANNFVLRIYEIFKDCVIPNQTKTEWLFSKVN